MSSDEPRVVPSPRTVAVREIQLINRNEEMQILREAADRARAMNLYFPTSFLLL